MRKSKRAAVVLTLGLASLAYACSDDSGPSGASDPDAAVGPIDEAGADAPSDSSLADSSSDSPADANCTSTTFKRGLSTDIRDAGANAWTNPNNALAADGTSATTSVSAVDTLGDILSVKDFQLMIPASAKISGVEVKMICAGQSGNVVDGYVFISGGGAAQSFGRMAPGPWPSTLTARTYGGPADSWGLVLTPAILNATDFSVGITPQYSSGGGAVSVLVDEVTVSVHYCH